MDTTYQPPSRRKKLNSLLRNSAGGEIEKLKILLSLLEQAKPQHIPPATIEKVEQTTYQIKESLLKLGLPNSRLTEITEEK